jgi:hypothetical protein
MKVNISVFEKMATIEMRSAIGNTERMTDGSITKPMVTKKTVAKRFRIGIIDFSTSLYCIVSAEDTM